jgi:hypothetical protein
LLATFKRCDLYGIGQEEARARLAEYLTPAAKPTSPARFPGSSKSPQAKLAPPEPVRFPGKGTASQGLLTAVSLQSSPPAEHPTSELGQVPQLQLISADQAPSSRASQDKSSRTGMLVAGAASAAFIIIVSLSVVQSRRTSEPAAAAPAIPTQTTSDTGVAERPIINVSPEFLMDLYANKTRLQGDAAASLYVDKWLNFHGAVADVSRSISGDIILVSRLAGLRTIDLWVDGRDKNIASTYSIGQNIDAICQIKEADSFSLVLQKCELTVPVMQ